MRISKVDLVIWILGAILQLCLFVILITRNRRKNYPWFTLFIAYQNLATLILFLFYTKGAAELYRRAYWLSEALCFLLEIAVSAEMFAAIWRRVSPKPFVPWASLIRWGCFSMLLALVSAFSVGGPGMPTIDLLALRGAIFTSFLLCGFFISVSAKANALHLRRSMHAMFIGWGLTGIALLELTEDFRFFTQGWHRGNNVFDRAEGALYTAILLFWAIGMWYPENLRWPRAHSVMYKATPIGH